MLVLSTKVAYTQLTSTANNLVDCRSFDFLFPASAVEASSKASSNIRSGSANSHLWILGSSTPQHAYPGIELVHVEPNPQYSAR